MDGLKFYAALMGAIIIEQDLLYGWKKKKVF